MGKTNYWMVSTLVLLGIIIGFGVSQMSYFKDIGSKGKTQVIDNKEEKRNPVKAVLNEEQMKAMLDDDLVLGDPNAPISVVEFSDFQCSFCAKFGVMIFPSIDENYIKTGKVKFVYRDFPLDSHPNAGPMALAAECADEQGKFREMHDMIFERQNEWSPSEKINTVIKEYGKKIGLDGKQFNECVSSKKYAGEIRKDLIDGASNGVSGTPSFFINGKPLSGAMPFDIVFKPIFDAELEGKEWEVQYDAAGRPSVKVY